MKKSIMLLLLLLSSIAFGQNNNFIVEDSLIIWRKVYENSKNFLELKNNPRLEFKTDTTGFIKKTNFSNDKLYELVGEFRIEFKENRYRVSIFNIRFYKIGTNTVENAKELESTTDVSIEKVALKRNGNVREYTATEELNRHFINLFTIKAKGKSDW
jgi:hypothetical protein